MAAEPWLEARRPAAWRELAAAAARAVVAGWPTEAPPERTVKILEHLQHDSGTPDWTALTVLRPVVQQRSAALATLELLAAASPRLARRQDLQAVLAASSAVHAAKSSELKAARLGKTRKQTLRRLATPFMRSHQLFPFSGGFELWLEEEQHTDGETHLSMRLSSSPQGPLALQALILLEASVLDVRVEFRGDDNVRVRLPGKLDAGYWSVGPAASGSTGEIPLLERLHAAVCCSANASSRSGQASTSCVQRSDSGLSQGSSGSRELGVAIRLCRPPGDLGGRPGGTGWIPWIPSRPTLGYLTI